ncbi:MAG: UDP-N-acetylmuramate:L-alanyl-gamma-D-glutamyl-meso-diaminopimelate ligase [Deltaproteobacteria bacterium]|nr:MAG: UDP-N-acetylmuramate:L-alanyl-gamma-D-glutamyl-meso-diaminopimelate ligase [Deltaproteobacteria bacterium]
MPLIDALPENLKTIHIIGIAGTAMGALAGMLKDAGYEVTGSDTGCYPPMSDYLEGLGIDVMIGFNASNLDHDPDLVVVGNVVRAVYEEAQALIERDLPYCSLPQILGHRYLDQAHSVVVSGTHGKTTTTSITAWLLEAGGLEPGFLIGGVAKNFDRTARAGAGTHFVIEGDEYDTAFFDKRPKFLHYRPNTCILTSVEFDHADIYRDLDHVKESFRALMDILPEDGLLIVRGDDPGAMDVARGAQCEVWTYGPGFAWDGRIDSVDTDRGVMTFTVTRNGEAIGTFESSLVGEHNLYNQVAACAAAFRQGLDAEALAKGFASFQGIRRRQELRGTPGDIAVIDDFAHHPTAVELTLQALRQRFGERRLWAVWEPRSATSRRRVFQDAYASAFGEADLVIIGAPYDQSRIAEDERFSSDELVQALTQRGLDAMTLEDADQIAATLIDRAQPHDVIAVLSNGAFGGLHSKLLEGLAERFEP